VHHLWTLDTLLHILVSDPLEMIDGATPGAVDARVHPRLVGRVGRVHYERALKAAGSSPPSQHLVSELVSRAAARAALLAGAAPWVLGEIAHGALGTVGPLACPGGVNHELARRTALARPDGCRVREVREGAVGTELAALRTRQLLVCAMCTGCALGRVS